jgi:hypothetical protein
MSNKMTEYLEKEQLLSDSVNIKKIYDNINKADNERLKSYFIEFSKQIDDPKLVQGAYLFIKWIVENK